MDDHTGLLFIFIRHVQTLIQTGALSDESVAPNCGN